MYMPHSFSLNNIHCLSNQHSNHPSRCLSVRLSLCILYFQLLLLNVVHFVTNTCNQEPTANTTSISPQLFFFCLQNNRCNIWNFLFCILLVQLSLSLCHYFKRILIFYFSYSFLVFHFYASLVHDDIHILMQQNVGHCFNVLHIVVSFCIWWKVWVERTTTTKLLKYIDSVFWQ